MKILTFCAYYTPEIAASMYLTENLFEDFAKNGINIEMFAPTPTRGVDKNIIQKYKKIKFEKKYNNKLIVHRFSMIQEGEGSIGRFFRYLLLTTIFFHYGLHTKADMMFIDSTPPLQGPMAAILKKVKRIPFVYNLQDIFPDSLVNTGLSNKDSLLWKIGRKMEDFTYKYADRIVVISEDFKKNIMAKGVPEEKITIINNWVDENAVNDIPKDKNTLFDEYDLDINKFYICYSGNVGLTQNMDMLLDVAKELKENCEIGFVIVGDGVYKENVENRIKHENISNVTLIPFQPYERISETFSLGDCGLVISKANIGNNSVPSKTWSIMAASRPVLASFDKGSELENVIVENDCGICADADDKDSFKSAILEMFSDYEKVIEKGKNGRKYIENNLTRNVGTLKWVDLIKNLMQVEN